MPPALAIILAALLGLFPAAAGEEGTASRSTNRRAAPSQHRGLDTLVAAERAFSKLSVEEGMKEAFLSCLADDAILFRPAPVNGKRLWNERENPAGTLVWEPSYAEISGAGDFGVTSGPWEFRPAAERKLPTGHGHFVSVWRRSKDGEWQVAADIGIEHAKPRRGLGAVALTPGPPHSEPPPAPREFGGAVFGGGLFSSGTGVGFGFASGPGYIPREQRLRAHAINEMMKAERAIPFVGRSKGLARAYAEHADADVRVYRNGSLPTIGVTEALPALAGRAGRLELIPYGDGMSSSYDLGYSYGLLTRSAKGAARADSSAYLHVWRKDEAGRWKLALDVENEFPKRE